MSVDNYREQVKNPVILEYIREEMDMKDVPLSSIASKITLNEIKDTDLITIKVTDENPETAAKIANLVGDRFANLCAKQTKNGLRVHWSLLKIR